MKVLNYENNETYDCYINDDKGYDLNLNEGTLYGYPQCTMGAHVSACPNHQTGNSTSIEFLFERFAERGSLRSKSAQTKRR